MDQILPFVIFNKNPQKSSKPCIIVIFRTGIPGSRNKIEVVDVNDLQLYPILVEQGEYIINPLMRMTGKKQISDY